MPVTDFLVPEKYRYQNGFKTYFESEAIEGALPKAINSPQKPPYGLYTERISGSSFTAPRDKSLQTWTYRMVPSSNHSPFEQCEVSAQLGMGDLTKELKQIPNQTRWEAFDMNKDVDWIRGLHLLAGAGSPVMKTGLGYYVYACGKDMKSNEAFYSADGDFLIVPQIGTLDICTELGNLLVRAGEMVVIPRGIRYQVTLPHGPARGFIAELYEGHFELPNLGAIGSCSLANERDFQAPVASIKESTDKEWKLSLKFCNQLYSAKQNHNPFDVVAWHGTYYPYKYDLGRFSSIGSISYDHPDPSIFTVLTAPSSTPGTAICDFVIFPQRWNTMEDTFWPPYYHRNTMSEFSGLLGPAFKGPPGSGYQAGEATLHNVMAAHGPDKRTWKHATNAKLTPAKTPKDALAFMFESSLMIGVTEWGLKTKVQEKYSKQQWGELESNFVQPEGKKALKSVL